MGIKYTVKWLGRILIRNMIFIIFTAYRSTLLWTQARIRDEYHFPNLCCQYSLSVNIHTKLAIHRANRQHCQLGWQSIIIVPVTVIAPLKSPILGWHPLSTLPAPLAAQAGEMSHDLTKPTKWLCAQRRLRSALVSAQSDQSLLCAQSVAKGPSFLYADSEDSDQTGQMPRLIWVFAGRTIILLVLSCRGSKIKPEIKAIIWNVLQKQVPGGVGIPRPAPFLNV